MKIATDTDCFFGLYSIEETIDILANAGFDAIDYSVMEERFVNGEMSDEECRKYFENVKDYAENAGIVFNQSHAMGFGAVTSDEIKEKNFRCAANSIKLASYLGAGHTIVHGVEFGNCAEDDKERLFEANMEFYNGLKPYCEEYGVKVAIENLPHTKEHIFGSKVVNSTCAIPEDFVKYVDALDKNWFTACLDIGHAMVTGHNPESFIRTLGGERLTALHVHDNNGLRDMHTLPYLGGMANWDGITKALADIDYKGDFNFEAGNFLKPLPKELYPCGAKMIAETGKYLVNKINEYKNN